MGASIRRGLCRLLHHSGGATLIELLIAITISGLLVTLFLYSDLTVKRDVLSWSVKSELEKSVILTREQLKADLLRLDSLVSLDSNHIKFLTSDCRTVEYSIAGGKLLLDGDIVLPAGVSISRFRFLRLNESSDNSNGDAPEYLQSGFILRFELMADRVKLRTVEIPIRPWKNRRITSPR